MRIAKNQLFSKYIGNLFVFRTALMKVIEKVIDVLGAVVTFYA